MKKLQKLVLHKAKIMTAPQMKHIIGGYDGYDNDECERVCTITWINGTTSEGTCTLCSKEDCEDLSRFPNLSAGASSIKCP
jgi:hypothetical protein